MRARSRILSGVSLISLLAAVGAVGPATAADTLSGPGTFDPYVNAQTDSVTIDLDATVDADALTNDSFFNNLSMTAAGANLTVNDSFLLGDIVNEGSMTGGANAIDIIADSQIDGGIFQHRPHRRRQRRYLHRRRQHGRRRHHELGLDRRGLDRHPSRRRQRNPRRHHELGPH
jgi:hypothetical protein